MDQLQKRRERFSEVLPETTVELLKGIKICFFASSNLGAVDLSTGLAFFDTGARLPYHTHPCGESITPIKGNLEVAVEGRTYLLLEYDSIHVPAGVAHSVVSIGENTPSVVSTAFSSGEVSRTLVEGEFRYQSREGLMPGQDDPESLTRFRHAAEYKLSTDSSFRDLFSARTGAKGICGGYGRLDPGSCLGYQTAPGDLTITILSGKATCLVSGNKYFLKDYATVHVPMKFPYQIANETEESLEMLWIQAGDEPQRAFVADSHVAEK